MAEFIQAGWANSAFRDDNSGKVVILFHTVQKKMEMESKLRGTPVFKEVVFITKIVPGDKGHVIDRPVRENDIESDSRDFPVEWARFQAGQQGKVIGFPIENWPSISDTQKAEFKAMKVDTLEQLAGLSDGVLGRIMGGKDLRHKAQVFVESGKDAELVGTIRRESEARESALQAQIDEMKAMLEKFTAPDKKQKVSA